MFRSTIALSLLSMTLASLPANAEGSLESLICRSHDYYQMGGDRKTLEISLNKQAGGQFNLKISRTFDVLLPNHEYQERNRYTETEMVDLNCVQASGAIDPKVVTCTGATLKSYFNLSRIDRTLIMSELSSKPGKIVQTVTYEAAILGDHPKEFRNFTPAECVLN